MRGQFCWLQGQISCLFHLAHPFQMSASGAAQVAVSWRESWEINPFVTLFSSAVYLTGNKDGSDNHGKQPVTSHQSSALCLHAHI